MRSSKFPPSSPPGRLGAPLYGRSAAHAKAMDAQKPLRMLTYPQWCLFPGEFRTDSTLVQSMASTAWMALTS